LTVIIIRRRERHARIEWRTRRGDQEARRSRADAATRGHHHLSTRRRARHASTGTLRIPEQVQVNGVFQHLFVEMQTEFTRTDWTELAEHDVFTHASHSISLRKRRRFHEDIDGFLKRTSHQRTSFRAVNTVTSDGHQMASVRHYLDENRQMSVVDV